MKTSDRSRKAREAHADYLLKTSNSLMTAFLITVLIIPMGAIINSIFFSTQNNSLSFGMAFSLLLSFKIWAFAILECLIAGIALKLKDQALDIYDELYPDPKGDEIHGDPEK